MDLREEDYVCQECKHINEKKARYGHCEIMGCMCPIHPGEYRNHNGFLAKAPWSYFQT